MRVEYSKRGSPRINQLIINVMKQSIAIETILFTLMLVSTLVILISMGVRDVNLCLLSFATFLFSAVMLIVKLKK